MKNIVKSIFENVDGYTCRVKSDGLYVNGSMEGEVKIKSHDWSGVSLLVPLQWNDTNITRNTLSILNNHLGILNRNKGLEGVEDISMEARDQIHEELLTMISNTWVNAGTILLTSIKDIKLTYRDNTDLLYSIEIVYEKSTVLIYSLKAPKV